MIWQHDYMKSYAERPDDPYVKLAHAIVIQAVKDYQDALRNKNSIIEFRNFFHSAWFSVLTRDRIDGAVIFYRIKNDKKLQRTNITI